MDRTAREAAPAEIYYLAAQSSVWRSFEAPVAAFEGSAIGLINLLEAARAETPDARIFNAASGDCFGEALARAVQSAVARHEASLASAPCVRRTTTAAP